VELRLLVGDSPSPVGVPSGGMARVTVGEAPIVGPVSMCACQVETECGSCCCPSGCDCPGETQGCPCPLGEIPAKSPPPAMTNRAIPWARAGRVPGTRPWPAEADRGLHVGKEAGTSAGGRVR
jgi:hypothetical protein